eukprot:CCRYP_012355-RA/>CCRYP_012355-RA protein AED:0.25 eAED:0.25 QI:144/1/1/1/1/1/2/689/680
MRSTVMQPLSHVKLVLALHVIAVFDGVVGFSALPAAITHETTTSSFVSPHSMRFHHVHFAKTSDDSEGDEAPLSDSDDEDWRAFRAKLVLSEGTASGSPSSSSSPTERPGDGLIVDDSDLDGIGAVFSDSEGSSGSIASQSKFVLPPGFTPLDPSQWAYDSGKVIEKGAVILGGVEQDFGFGLRQQYFHKAVILVIDHDENKFTKGIILNRPSEKVLADDVNKGVEWRVWFGGDVQGLDSILPDIVCLHSLKSEEATIVSEIVMKDIQWTTFANAKSLVKRGVASVQDFWLFAGYAGWGPKQLSGELDRKSWYMCATDSQTLLKELARQSSGVDPRDAGLQTWELLMNMIGRGEKATQVSGQFDDLMLKEWGRGNLLLKGGGYNDIGVAKNPLWGAGVGFSEMDMNEESVDSLMKQAKGLITADELTAGTLLRASSAERSPFLLQKQEFHKSLVLIVIENEKGTVGIMLNHPAAKGLEVKNNRGERSSIIPLRYGGDFSVKGVNPVMWLHCSQQLRDSGVGTPFAEHQHGGIYVCNQDEAVDAISRNAAEPHNFLVVSGLCVWPKLGGSLGSEVKKGIFEVVPQSNIEHVFQILQKQKVLSAGSLDTNVQLSQDAWREAATGNSAAKPETSDVLTVGIGEGFDEEDDSFVFNSSKKVSDLANDALKKWIATFLLGSPTLA